MERAPPAYRRSNIRDGVAHSVEAIAFESAPGFFVTGNIYRPKTTGPKPAIVHFHGHFKFNGRMARMSPEVQALSSTLADMGAIVLVLDMVGWGESNQIDHGENGVLALQLWNGIRALDLLLAESDVDRSRIAAMGASGGGSQSLLLAAVDERLTALATVVMLSAQFAGGDNCEVGMPVRRPAGTTNAEIAATFAPKAQLIVSVGSDWTRTVPRVEGPWIREYFYAPLVQENAFQADHFEAEAHDLGPSKRAALYRFFASTFGLPAANREVNEYESVDALRFYGGGAPRPPRLSAAEVLSAVRRLAN